MVIGLNLETIKAKELGMTPGDWNLWKSCQTVVNGWSKDIHTVHDFKGKEMLGTKEILQLPEVKAISAETLS